MVQTQSRGAHLEKLHELAMRQGIEYDYILAVVFTPALLRGILCKVGERLVLASLLFAPKNTLEQALLWLRSWPSILQSERQVFSYFTAAAATCC